MNTQNTTTPSLHHIAAARFSVVLLFGLLIASTVSAASAGTHDHIDEYTGSETCLACHQEEGEEIATSVHNTWLGTAKHVVGKEGETTGKSVGINDLCINIKSNEVSGHRRVRCVCAAMH